MFYARINYLKVHDTRPPSARPNFSDLSSVEKYALPSSTYESLPNSVLAWKKAQKLGRFDPNARSPEELIREQAENDEAEVQKRGESIFLSFLLPPGHEIVNATSRDNCLCSRYYSTVFSTACAAWDYPLHWTSSYDPFPGL